MEIESENTIRLQVNKLVNYVSENKNKNNFMEMVSEHFSEFQNKYPTLFKQIINSECDFKQLDMMLKQLEKVRNGSISQHNASVQIGQVLVDKYVKPQLNIK